MLDLRNEYNFAVGKIQEWRGTYESNVYPHKVVLNMMYRAYATRKVFEMFQSGVLPHYSDFMSAAQAMLKLYGEAAGFINPFLQSWLSNNPNEQVGTLTFSRYEAMASRAEYNKKDKEELEFSYIFETLNDFAVLYFIAMRLSGKSEVDSISNLCVVIIAKLPYMDYTITKQAFQQLWISRYMNDNYRPLP